MRIVVTADDFGLTPDTVRSTIQAFEDGLLTSASIMPGTPASADAIAYATANPDLSFGVHLTLVGDGLEAPIEEPSRIPALVDAEGRFRSARDVRLRALLRRLPAAELERELAAQIAAVVDAGVQVTHVDSHRHLHKFGVVRTALRHVTERLRIERVRAVQDVYLRLPLRSPTFWVGRAWQRGIRRDFTTTDHFYMPTSTGDAAWERVVSRLDSLRGETIEIGLHPGSDEDWRRGELAGLEPFVAEARRRGHELIGWRDVGHHR